VRIAGDRHPQPGAPPVRGREHRLPGLVPHRQPRVAQEQHRRCEPFLLLDEQAGTLTPVELVQGGPPHLSVPVPDPQAGAVLADYDLTGRQVLVPALTSSPRHRLGPGREHIGSQLPTRRGRHPEVPAPSLGDASTHPCPQELARAVDGEQLLDQQRAGLPQPQPAGPEQVGEGQVASIVAPSPGAVGGAIWQPAGKTHVPPLPVGARCQPLHPDRPSITGPQRTRARTPSRSDFVGRVTGDRAALVLPGEELLARRNLATELRPGDSVLVVRVTPTPVLEVEQIGRGRRPPRPPLRLQEAQNEA